MSDRSLEGDTALVTGAASGIGRGIAQALAREGARIVLADIDAARGEPIAAALKQEGFDARFIASDLSTTEGPAALLQRMLDALGSISILVHSASPRRLEADTLLEVSDATWHGMIAVNLHAGFALARGAAKEMIARGTKGRMLFLTLSRCAEPGAGRAGEAPRGGVYRVRKPRASPLYHPDFAVSIQTSLTRLGRRRIRNLDERIGRAPVLRKQGKTSFRAILRGWIQNSMHTGRHTQSAEDL